MVCFGLVVGIVWLDCYGVLLLDGFFVIEYFVGVVVVGYGVVL